MKLNIKNLSNDKLNLFAAEKLNRTGIIQIIILSILFIISAYESTNQQISTSVLIFIDCILIPILYIVFFKGQNIRITSKNNIDTVLSFGSMLYLFTLVLMIATMIFLDADFQTNLTINQRPVYELFFIMLGAGISEELFKVGIFYLFMSLISNFFKRTSFAIITLSIFLSLLVLIGCHIDEGPMRIFVYLLSVIPSYIVYYFTKDIRILLVNRFMFTAMSMTCFFDDPTYAIYGKLIIFVYTIFFIMRFFVHNDVKTYFSK